ncbi:MAG TPA: hypothetical protein PKI34_11875 [Bacteroidales bacterium]|nr:hypothetical protein [Bacteroidales bacterium]
MHPFLSKHPHFAYSGQPTASTARKRATGRATVAHGSVQKEPLSATMRLRASQMIILAQSVGYPKE